MEGTWLGEGEDLGSGLGGAWIGTPGQVWDVRPRSGPRGQAPGLRPRWGASSMCQRRRGSGLPVPAGRRFESPYGPASRPACSAASCRPPPLLWLRTQPRGWPPSRPGPSQSSGSLCAPTPPSAPGEEVGLATGVSVGKEGAGV